MTNSEQQIRRDLAELFRWDMRLEGASLRIHVTGTSVTLSGTAPSYEARMAAEACAWNVPGIGCVDNEITVRSVDGHGVVLDTEIRLQVEGMLAASAKLNGTRVSIGVNNGEIHLQGMVDALWKKKLIEELAAQARGVLRISNRICVVPGLVPEDRQIAAAVEEAFARNSPADFRNVDVRVELGVVTLSGTVPSWDAFSRADSVAERTPGALSVKNRLAIRPNERQNKS